MKILIYILSIILIGFLGSCKKAKISNKVDNTSWEISQITLDGEDKTEELLKSETIYKSINYGAVESDIIYSNPTRESVTSEEIGEWKLEKIVPTVGDSYYLIKNTMAYSQKRAKVFNLHEYGSEVVLSEKNILTQTIGNYIITYTKVN